jgi:hypothetical protein
VETTKAEFKQKAEFWCGNISIIFVWKHNVGAATQADFSVETKLCSGFLCGHQKAESLLGNKSKVFVWTEKRVFVGVETKNSAFVGKQHQSFCVDVGKQNRNFCVETKSDFWSGDKSRVFVWNKCRVFVWRQK